MSNPGRRATYLSVPEYRLLEDWAENLVELFRGETPYLVGSVLERSDYRDVDVRLIVDPSMYEDLDSRMDLSRLGVVVSLWGQRVTGLNIDFQVQLDVIANTQFSGRRNALGLRRGDLIDP